MLANWQQLINDCHAALAHAKTAQFRILSLDRKNGLPARGDQVGPRDRRRCADPDAQEAARDPTPAPPPPPTVLATSAIEGIAEETCSA